jgi:molybdopterin molybdotransferase
VTVDDARTRILARITPLDHVEMPLLDALGFVLAEPVVAAEDLPAFRSSAMDGYAVRGEDVRVPTTLRVVGTVAAGAMPDRSVGPGEAMRIMTGAPVPEGADTVVRVEDTDNGDAHVAIRRAVTTGVAVRPTGEDHRRGETVVAAGAVLRAGEIGMLASIGRSRVTVVRRPNVAIVSTGDELVDITETPRPGQIRDANRYSLTAAVRGVRAASFDLGGVGDTPSDLRHALGNAAFGDVVITSGGVSVGDHDHVKPVIESMGSIEFWSIAIRPGRPLAFGELRTKRGKIPIFGLPGNPVSALVTFELFVRPALLKMAGHTKLQRPRARARLEDRIEKPSGLRTFARGVHDSQTGTVRTTGPQGSNILGSVALANCLIDLPEAQTVAERGETVEVILTDSAEDH